MNFGNAMILQHFGPEKCQKSAPERQEFWEHHNSSLPWAKESPNPTTKDEFLKTALIDLKQKCQQNKESIHFSRISHLI